MMYYAELHFLNQIKLIYGIQAGKGTATQK